MRALAPSTAALGSGQGTIADRQSDARTSQVLLAPDLDRVPAKPLQVFEPNQTPYSYSVGRLGPTVACGEESRPDFTRALPPLSQKRVFLSVLLISHLKVDIQLNTMKPHSPEQ